MTVSAVTKHLSKSFGLLLLRSRLQKGNLALLKGIGIVTMESWDGLDRASAEDLTRKIIDRESNPLALMDIAFDAYLSNIGIEDLAFALVSQAENLAATALERALIHGYLDGPFGESQRAMEYWRRIESLEDIHRLLWEDFDSLYELYHENPKADSLPGSGLVAIVDDSSKTADGKVWVSDFRLAIGDVAADAIIDEVASILLNYCNYSDSISAALASLERSDISGVSPSYLRRTSLGGRWPEIMEEALEADEGDSFLDCLEDAFSTFLGTHWEEIIRRRMLIEEEFPSMLLSETIRHILIVMTRLGFIFYTKDSDGAGLDYLPDMLGLQKYAFGATRDGILHSSQLSIENILLSYESEFAESFKASSSVEEATWGMANRGHDLAGENCISFYGPVAGWSSTSVDAAEVLAIIQRQVECVRKKRGIEGSILLFSDPPLLTFEHKWQRRYPEYLYNISAHVSANR